MRGFHACIIAVLVLLSLSFQSIALNGPDGSRGAFALPHPYKIGPLTDRVEAYEDQLYSHAYFAVMGSMTLNSLTTSADWLSPVYTMPLVLDPTNLECDWTFDLGDAADSSGNGHHGTIFGATATTGVFDMGQTMSFDGDDHISIPHHPSLNITDEITVEAFIYPTNTDTKEHMILSKGGSWGDNDPQDYELTMDKDRPLFQVKIPNSFDWYGAAPMDTITKNMWHHVAGVYDGSRFYIYVDGINQTSLYNGWDASYKGAVYSGGLPTSMDNISIGRRAPASWGSLYFQGSIDNVRIFSRALGPDEVLEHATKGGENTLTLTGVPDNDDIGAVPVNINMTDGAGNFAERSFILSVINIGPTILTNDVLTVSQDELYSVDYEADDEGQGIWSWALDSTASWLSIDTMTGLLSGTPGPDDIGTYSVNVEFDDGNGGTDSTAFDLTVLNVNDAPAIGTENVLTVLQGEHYEVHYSVLDLDQGDTALWSLSTTADFLDLGPDDGILSGTPSDEDVGTHNVTIMVTDGSGEYDTTSFDLEVVNVNDIPVWDDLPKNTTVDEGALYVFDVNATDVDDLDTLTYGLASYPTSDISINATSGLIEWTGTREPFDSEPYRLALRVTASDGEETITHDFIIDLVLSLPPSSVLVRPGNGSTIGTNTTVLDWDGMDPDGKVVIYDLYFSDERAKVTSFSEDALIAEGLTFTAYQMWDLVQGATYYWTVVPMNDYTTGSCPNGTFSFYVNTPPRTVTVSPSNGEKVPLSGTSLAWTGYDVELDLLKCDVYVSRDRNNIVNLSGDSLVGDDVEGTLFWYGPLEPSAVYYWTVVPYDLHSRGACNEGAIPYFRANTPPVSGIIRNVTATAGEQMTVDLNFTDPDEGDEDALHFIIEGPLTGMTIDDGSRTFSWTPTEAQVGLHIVTITANDGQDNTTVSFHIEVLAPVIVVDDDDDGPGAVLWIVIVVAVILLLIILALVVFLMMRKRPEGAEPSTEAPSAVEPAAEPPALEGQAPAPGLPQEEANTLPPVQPPTVPTEPAPIAPPGEVTSSPSQTAAAPDVPTPPA